MLDIHNYIVYNIIDTHFKLLLRGIIILEKIDILLEQYGECMRMGMLAYFYCHKELLEDERYNRQYRILLDAQIKKYDILTKKVAEYVIEFDIKEIIKNADKEEIEEFRNEIDYIIDMPKRYKKA